MASLVELFESLIHTDWRLAKDGNQWVVRETQAGSSNIELRLGGCRSLGFSLDRDANPWPFIKETSQIRKVCDAIIITEYQGKSVIFVVEMKSAKTGTAYKQLESAKHLTEYLCQLLRLHTHWNGEYLIKGIISLSPNHERKKKFKRESRKESFPIHCIENTGPIRLPELMG